MAMKNTSFSRFLTRLSEKRGARDLLLDLASDLIGSVIEQMSRSPSTITVLGDHTLTHLASQGYFWPPPDPAKELRDHLKKRGEPA